MFHFNININSNNAININNINPIGMNSMFPQRDIFDRHISKKGEWYIDEHSIRRCISNGLYYFDMFIAVNDNVIKPYRLYMGLDKELTGMIEFINWDVTHSDIGIITKFYNNTSKYDINIENDSDDTILNKSIISNTIEYLVGLVLD